MASFSQDRAARLLLTATDLRGLILAMTPEEPTPEVTEAEAPGQAMLTPDPSEEKGVPETPRRRPSRRAPTAAAPTIIRSLQDRAEFSPYTRIFSNALQAIEASPQVRPQLVERMHRMLTEGRIAMDMIRLADRLIDHLEKASVSALAARVRKTKALLP